MMSKLKKCIICFVSISLIGLYLYYFNPHKKITLTLGIFSESSWDVPNANAYQNIDQIIKNFEKKYPYVNVKYESGISKSDYSQWLSNKIVNGTQPDVYIVLREDFNLLSSTHALTPLNSYMDKDLINENIYYQSAYQAGIYHNNVYGLPIESNPVMICANMNILNKEGIVLKENMTIEEFYKICQNITKDTNNDGVIDQFGVCDYSWQYIIQGYGIQLFNEEGTDVYLNNSKVKNALYMAQNIQQLSAGHSLSSTDFDQGKVAFMPMTLAQYRTYKTYPYHVSHYSTFSWNCITMPGSSKAAFQMDTSLLAMSSKSTHKNMAWEFIKLMSVNQSTQQMLFEKTQGASPIRAVMKSKQTQQLLKSEEFGKDVLTPSTIDSIIDRSVSYPKFKKYNTISERADYLITQSINANTIDTDLATIEQKIQKEL